MRKIVFCILAILLVSQSGFAWDTTAAKYYPLKVGNSYVFRNFVYHVDCSGAFSGKSKGTITAETVMPNGKKYFQFGAGGPVSGNPYITFWSYQRIDSATMNVYGYNPDNGQEYLLDSLRANSGNTVRSSRFLLSGWNVTYHTNTINIFGAPRTERIYFTGASPKIVTYSLIEGIGYAGYSYCVDDGASSELIGCVINGIVYGDTVTTSVTQISTEVPEKFSLKQNYPNPFNPSTKINYELKSAGFVSLKVFDIMGKEVSELVNENQNVGIYEVTFDASYLPAGVYYFKISVNDFSEVKKMTLIK